MFRDLSDQGEERLSGEEDYRGVSTCPGRHHRQRRGRSGWRGGAGRDDPQQRSRHRPIGGVRPWRKPLAVHDPAKTLLDLAVALAIGGDCLADVNLLRAEPGVYGAVASESTVSRLVDALADDVSRALSAIETARAAARTRVWALAGDRAPDHDRSATTPGDHRPGRHARDVALGQGTGPGDVQTRLRIPPAVRVRRPRPGRHRRAGAPDAAARYVGSNTAADHIAVTRKALAQLPGYSPGVRPGRKVLIRTDGAGATHAFLDWLSDRRLSYSIGFTLGDITEVLAAMP